MSMRKEHGFSRIGIIVGTIAICLIALLSFYLYSLLSGTNKGVITPNPAVQVRAQAKDMPAITDPTTNWTPYTTIGKSFSFRYPTTWTKNVCDDNFVLLGPTAGSAGHCQSDATAQIVLSSVKGDKRTANKLAPASYPDLSSQSVTVSGLTGTRESGTLKTTGDVFVGPTNGSKVVNYVFYDKDTTYVMSYTQTPEFTDVLSDFELIVTNSLKFL